ncbi:MAG: hypothetical protein HY681_10945 [Chloroflexi bacterium]|nr:hypothetical protein [Chloroflexota bacterium]
MSRIGSTERAAGRAVSEGADLAQPRMRPVVAASFLALLMLLLANCSFLAGQAPQTAVDQSVRAIGANTARIIVPDDDDFALALRKAAVVKSYSALVILSTPRAYGLPLKEQAGFGVFGGLAGRQQECIAPGYKRGFWWRSNGAVLLYAGGWTELAAYASLLKAGLPAETVDEDTLEGRPVTRYLVRLPERKDAADGVFIAAGARPPSPYEKEWAATALGGAPVQVELWVGDEDARIYRVRLTPEISEDLSGDAIVKKARYELTLDFSYDFRGPAPVDPACLHDPESSVGRWDSGD